MIREKVILMQIPNSEVFKECTGEGVDLLKELSSKY
jgi:hypothetical protein